MRTLHLTLLMVAGLSLLLAPLGGCPTDGQPDTDGNGNGNGAADQAVDTSIFTVVKTGIRVQHDASLECGDDLIAFGTGPVTGVSYVIPSDSPPVAAALPAEFRSSGFAVAGKKILAFAADFRLSVFDTQTQTLTDISLQDVCLESLPTDDDEDFNSPVIADGQLAITRNRADQVTDGRKLKLIDVSGDAPVITPLRDPPAGFSQMLIDATDGLVIVFGDDTFFVYDITQPDADPQEIDLSRQGRIAGPMAYDDGYILYVADTFPTNIRLVAISGGPPIQLATAPAHRLLTLAMGGGRYAYFLDRDAFDTYSIVYRAAVGQVPQTEAQEGGEPGEDPAQQARPWEGYGDDVAITPDGHWIFITGNQGINFQAEFLQVSKGGVFTAFADDGGFLNASDLDATADLLAFKTGIDEDTTLGYMVLPE